MTKIKYSPLNTFELRAIDFFSNIKNPVRMPQNVSAINPYEGCKNFDLLDTFYSKYYSDNNPRIAIFGINPGRFGSGVTGIPFTDPVALEDVCKIKSGLEKRRELSSQFIYKIIQQYGGPKKFYKTFFISALSPIGFLKNGKNYNYYDDRQILKATQPYIVKMIKKQISLGIRTDKVIILGACKNMKFFTKLHDQHNFFEKAFSLEHPRYIMQYKRKDIDYYTKKYLEMLSI
jgi:hypothetical protein